MKLVLESEKLASSSSIFWQRILLRCGSDAQWKRMFRISNVMWSSQAVWCAIFRCSLHLCIYPWNAPSMFTKWIVGGSVLLLPYSSGWRFWVLLCLPVWGLVAICHGIRSWTFSKVLYLYLKNWTAQLCSCIWLEIYSSDIRRYKCSMVISSLTVFYLYVAVSV